MNLPGMPGKGEGRGEGPLCPTHPTTAGPNPHTLPTCSYHHGPPRTPAASLSPYTRPPKTPKP